MLAKRTIAIAIGLGMALALAQGIALASPLVLTDALRAAALEHPSIAASRNEREAAVMQLDGAERQRYPGLVAQSGNDSFGSRVTTLRLEQPLWAGGRITGEIALAKATIAQADAALLLAQQDIMLRVVAAFTELGRVQARQAAARDNLQEHARLAQMIARRVASQVSPRSDGVLAEARLSQARAELQQLDALATRAQAALAQTTGKAVVDVAALPPAARHWANLNEAIAWALDVSPAVHKLDAELEAATATIAVRRSSLYPQVTLRLDRNIGGTSAKSQVYVALEYQTGAGFSAQASVREAQARRDSVRAQIEIARRELVDAASGDWADLNAAMAQSANLQAQIHSTGEVYNSFMRQYAVGRKSWNDVLNAQREQAQARYQLADAESAAQRAALRLDLMTGRLGVAQLAVQTPDPHPEPAIAARPANGSNPVTATADPLAASAWQAGRPAEDPVDTASP